MSAGETLWEVQQRLLKEREMKIRSALEKLKRKRKLLRSRRQRCHFPVVSVLGYTNCGESQQQEQRKRRRRRSSEPQHYMFLLLSPQEKPL